MAPPVGVVRGPLMTRKTKPTSPQGPPLPSATARSSGGFGGEPFLLPWGKVRCSGVECGVEASTECSPAWEGTLVNVLCGARIKFLPRHRDTVIMKEGLQPLP